MPKSLKNVPKCWNFAKSGHTAPYLLFPELNGLGLKYSPKNIGHCLGVAPAAEVAVVVVVVVVVEGIPNNDKVICRYSSSVSSTLLIGP